MVEIESITIPFIKRNMDTVNMHTYKLIMLNVCISTWLYLIKK